MQQLGRPALAAMLAGTAVSSILPATAVAQVQPKTGETVQEVVVTGSRIARRDYVATSPLVTVGQDQLQSTGDVNVDQALAKMPQFNATTSTATGGQSSPTGNGAITTLNLRGLGANRNLILLDGRRLPVANSAGNVDISTIPSSIIGNVEVITGGASAVYGSDAISGVVNFITRKHFLGTELNVQGGITERGDGKNVEVSLMHGLEFADGRGTLLISGTYDHRGSVPSRAFAPYISRYVQPQIANGSTNLSGPNAPAQAAINAVFAKYGVAPGTVFSPNFGFNSDGTLFGIIGGVNLKDNGGSPPRYHTSPIVIENFDLEGNKVSDQNQYTAFGRAEYKFTESTKGYLQVLFSQTDTTGLLPPTFTFPPPTIPTTNPFIPADLTQLLASRPNPAAPFTLSKNFPEFGLRETEDTNRTYQVVIGLSGELPFAATTWDVYYARGGTTLDSSWPDQILFSKLQALLNAQDGGISLCTGGFNPFGLKTPADVSSACRQFLSYTTHSTTDTGQNIVEGTLGGKLFKLPAGDIRYALTATYRDDSIQFTPDPLLATGGVLGLSGTAAFPTTTISVKEIAAELLLPLLANQPMVQSLDVTLGGRYSDYNTVGGVKSYKAEGDWRVNPSVMFRGGYERAVRAPNFAEALSPRALTIIGVGAAQGGPGDPCSISSPARAAGGAQLRQLCLATGVPSAAIDSATFPDVLQGHQGGNPNLQPETASTVTVGAVLTPHTGNSWADGLSASIDYYNIDISGVIAAISGANIILNCYNVNAGGNTSYSSDSQYCKAITRGSTGAIADVLTAPLNLGGLKTSGIDTQVNWSVPAWGDGRLTLSAYVNYLLTFKYQALPNTPFLDFAGYFGDNITHSLFTPAPHPTWKTNSRVTYSTDDYDVTLAWRFISGMPDVSNITTPRTVLPRTKSNNVFDLSGTYRINKRYVVNAGIINLFDSKPPHSAQQAGFVDLNTYDFLGRRFILGLKARF